MMFYENMAIQTRVVSLYIFVSKNRFTMNKIRFESFNQVYSYEDRNGVIRKYVSVFLYSFSRVIPSHLCLQYKLDIYI